MTRVYLDQWVWITLAGAQTGKVQSQEWNDALVAVRWAAKHGMASFPLSRAHYLETKHMPRDDQRETIGKLMLEISRGHRMTGYTDELARAEFVVALSRHLGRRIPGQQDARSVFGTGLGFVYGARVVGRIVRTDGQSLTDEELEMATWLEAMGNDCAELYILCGPPHDEDVPGYDPLADRLSAGEFVDLQEDQAQRFVQNSTSEHKASVLAAAEWCQLAPMVVEILGNVGMPPESIFGSREIMETLMEDMPATYTGLQMRTLQHQNPQRKWTRNDYYDLDSLSVSGIHCDIVCTERHWADILHRTQLPSKYNTKVLSTPRDLVVALTSAG